MTYRLNHIQGKSENSRDQISKKKKYDYDRTNNSTAWATYFRAFSNIAGICELEDADTGVIIHGKENLFTAI